MGHNDSCPEESMCSFVSGATEGCLLNHSAAGSQPIYHLAVMLKSRSEVHAETFWDSLLYPIHWCKSCMSKKFWDVLVMLWLLLALCVTSPIITMHNQIALWESDDFVSGGDNAKYDDQLKQVWPCVLLQSSLDWYESLTSRISLFGFWQVKVRSVNP